MNLLHFCFLFIIIIFGALIWGCLYDVVALKRKKRKERGQMGNMAEIGERGDESLSRVSTGMPIMRAQDQFIYAGGEVPAPPPPAYCKHCALRGSADFP